MAVIPGMLAIGLFTSFLGLLQPIYFTFTSCYAYGPDGCHSYHVGLLGFLPLFLGFRDPFTLLLSLLAVIPTILAP